MHGINLFLPGKKKLKETLTLKHKPEEVISLFNIFSAFITCCCLHTFDMIFTTLTFTTTELTLRILVNTSASSLLTG